jgi:hypothetical protein
MVIFVINNFQSLSSLVLLLIFIVTFNHTAISLLQHLAATI